MKAHFNHTNNILTDASEFALAFPLCYLPITRTIYNNLFIESLVLVVRSSLSNRLRQIKAPYEVQK